MSDDIRGTVETVPLKRDLLDLINQHCSALNSDKITNQIHHLVLLESLIKIGLDQIRGGKTNG